MGLYNSWYNEDICLLVLKLAHKAAAVRNDVNHAVKIIWLRSTESWILGYSYFYYSMSHGLLTPCRKMAGISAPPFDKWHLQYIPRNMHTVFALLCFVVVIHCLIFPYPSGLLHWHCGNLTIAPVPAKQHWWIWINTSCEFIMNDCITTTKQSTTKTCAYFLGFTVWTLFKMNNGWRT